MNKIYIDILKKIEEKGFLAYIVGGYVRDFVMGLSTGDVDIITNATPKDLNNIFNNVKKIYNEYGAVKLQIKNKVIDITTFRSELSYKDNKPDKIEYTSSLEEDLKRRDFTMNTIVMDSEENIIDLMNGINDIKNNIIKPVKDVNILFKEDKTRILRALRFMSTLDMKLDQSIIDYIVKNKEDLTSINANKKKEELDKLFKSKKCIRFLEFIKDYGLEEYIGIKSNNFKVTDTVIGSYSQLEITKTIPFTKFEKEQIKDIKELINKGTIDKYDIYKKGLYISQCAADILGISKKEINLIYTNLPIKGIIDINLKSEEICKLLNIKPGKTLGEIIHILEKEIVLGLIENDKEVLVERLSEYNERFKENI